VPLAASAAGVLDLERLLSPDERGRADRFAFSDLRRRFVVGRGALRSILARYTGTPAAAIRFRYGPRGKPALDQTPHRDAVRFNLANSHELALVGVARGRELGIDVEWTGRPITDPEQIAEQFFSPAERAALRAIPPPLRLDAFYTCWTRKEAYIKALGDGLALPLDAFDVSLAPDAPAALLAGRGPAAGVDRWSLRALDPGPGYRAALVVEGYGFHIRMHDLPREYQGG
jgi:4'-phosphopantetheinyl transferase